MSYTGEVTVGRPADVRELTGLTITKVAVDEKMSNNCYLLRCTDTGEQVLIDAAAELIPTRTLALCMVTRGGSEPMHAMTFGDPRSAWRAAMEVSAQAHVRYLDAPVRRVLSLVPPKYREMWTAAKGFYKVEPVVADGGEVILYAPHVTEFAPEHPQIEQVGYHCRDYFVRQPERFAGVPRSVLAHSTHLRGAGGYDERDGERCRVTVTLATGIPEERVRAVSLNYLSPERVDIEALRADPETLVVPDAGEVLFRLR